MDALKRGDVVTVASGSGYGGKPRPAIVVQADLFNETHASITVVPVTSTRVDAPLFRVPVAARRGTGLRAPSQVMVDKIVSVPRERIGGRIGQIAAADLEGIDRALRLWLSLS
jgi:mRNA interferase MazF